MDIWTKWIRSYCFFKKLDRPENGTLLDDPELIVSWLQKPVIDADGWSEKPDIENPSFVFSVRAYLAIYRIDYQPTEIKGNVAPRVTLDKS